ncbi:MAG: helix-turn-helix domain-containing protein [Adhaeribacter sp.]
MALSEVNEKIKFIRTYLQLSPAEFASYLGLSESLILRIETPGEEIPVQVLLSLLEKMNVSTDWILTGRGNVFTQEGGLQPPQSLEDSKTEKHGFYLGEAELDQRIAALEQLIKDETHLPLEQIHALFRHLLNLEISFLQPAPGPAGQQAAARQSPFFEKIIYYQELQRQVNGARQEFLRHFTRLVELTRDHKPLN